MLHAPAHRGRHHRSPRLVGPHTHRGRREGRRNGRHQRDIRLPQPGLRDEVLPRPGRDSPHRCPADDGPQESQSTHADMFLPLGLLRLPHQQLRRAQHRDGAQRMRARDGRRGQDGGRLRLRHPRQRRRHGRRLRPRARLPLHARHQQVHTHLAALLHPQQPGDTQPRGQDEAHRQPRRAPGQARPLLRRQHRARHTAARQHEGAARARRQGGTHAHRLSPARL